MRLPSVRSRRGIAASAAVLAATSMLSFLPTSSASAEANGLALTPPMGFNDWNAVHCGVSESFIKSTAKLMHDDGLLALGYNYVNIDDCWAAPNRDKNGNLQADPSNFPDGIAGTAAYVHSLGMKLGLYNDSGTHSCETASGKGVPGSLGHEAQDALQFAKWGVDYLKDDDCNIPTQDRTVSATLARYKAQSDGLIAAAKQTGQNIVFSVCEKGDFGVPNSDWPSMSNLWRTTFDVHTDWTRLDAIIDQNIPMAPLAKPGAWNDPDMLEVGNTGLTTTEQQTQFSMWAEMAAPLLIGTKIAGASSTTLNILKNSAVIKIDQDPLGKQGVQVSDKSGLRVLAKPLSNGDIAVAFFNETGSTATISTTAKAVGFSSHPHYILENLWTHKNSTTASSSWKVSVPSHATVMWRVHGMSS